MSGDLAVTWWGHATATVELGGLHVVVDPVLSDRLWHLRRHAPSPSAPAAHAHVVLVSHLHGDHLHVPSLRRIASDAVIIAPRGAEPFMEGLADRDVRLVRPGDVVELADTTIEVLASRHDGRRSQVSRAVGLAQGFRVTARGRSLWYPGDTGLFEEMADVDPVDLALVPIGGWGPTLGDEHLDPEQAAVAVERVGARWAVPVHYGTFWPIGLRLLARANHRQLFLDPPERFVLAMADQAAEAVVPPHGVRMELRDSS